MGSHDEALQAQLIALAELRPDASAAPLKLAGNPLLDVKAQLQVSVGHGVISVGELMNAKLNHVVALDRAVDEPVDVLVEGRVVARGHLVAVGDHFGVCLTELPLTAQR